MCGENAEVSCAIAQLDDRFNGEMVSYIISYFEMEEDGSSDLRRKNELLLL